MAGSLFDGEAKQKPSASGYGELVEASYSNSGNSLGNLYLAEARRSNDGSLVVVISESPDHSTPAAIRTYRADEAVLERIDAIVNEAGAKSWGELPTSQFIALDASTPQVRLMYRNTDGSPRPLFLSFSANQELPAGGHEALLAIRGLIESFATEANFLSEETEQRR